MRTVLALVLWLCATSPRLVLAEDLPPGDSPPVKLESPVVDKRTKSTLTDKPEPFPSIGPTLSIEVPHPIFLDLEKRWNKSFSSAIGLGGFKLTVNTNSIPVSLGIGGADARFRWHPFQGAFFIGAMLGYQKIWGSGSDTINVTIPSVGSQNVAINANVTVSSFYVAPHVGWLWVFDSGFTLGVEAGYQFAFASNTSIDASGGDGVSQLAVDAAKLTSQYQTLASQVQDTGNQLGNLAFPYFCLIRIGYLF